MSERTLDSLILRISNMDSSVQILIRIGNNDLRRLDAHRNRPILSDNGRLFCSNISSYFLIARRVIACKEGKVTSNAEIGEDIWSHGRKDALQLPNNLDNDERVFVGE